MRFFDAEDSAEKKKKKKKRKKKKRERKKAHTNFTVQNTQVVKEFPRDPIPRS